LNISKKEGTVDKNTSQLHKGQMKQKTQLDTIREQVISSGIKPLKLSHIPFRLKRNEKIFFLAGVNKSSKFSVSLALTNSRFFFIKSTIPLRMLNKQNKLSITPGIKAIQLSSIIAIDKPESLFGSSSMEFNLHLDSGRDLSISIYTVQNAILCYVLLAELVDRLNDPVDESVFTPSRERILDDVKVAVWRRDKGACVRCGSREKLEYDHIIPVSKGGSNTARNIELLCQKCNREKTNKIQ